MRLLNLGCGTRYSTRPEWVNVDSAARPPHVIAHDLRAGIPFSDAIFDLVYHSHVLEHFSRANGYLLIEECWRVLRPGGVLRVAVPDLEAIARQYLAQLEAARMGSTAAAERYEWAVLEMFDQTVREQSAGGLLDFLRSAGESGRDHAIARCGTEARNLLTIATAPVTPTLPRPPWRRVLSAARSPSRWRESVVRALLGKQYQDLLLGRFRNTGEIHQWMYDSYSLARLLSAAGFADLRQYAATESRFPGWDDYHLDTEPDGRVYKPDSLFMESIKP